jgi:hypothetical protein
MSKVLASIGVVLAIMVGSSGCRPRASIEIPDQPVPPPNIDPVSATSSLAPAAAETAGPSSGPPANTP